MSFYLKLLNRTYINNVDTFSEDCFTMTLHSAGVSLENSPVSIPTLVVPPSPRKVVASEREKEERGDWRIFQDHGKIL